MNEYLGLLGMLTFATFVAAVGMLGNFLKQAELREEEEQRRKFLGKE